MRERRSMPGFAVSSTRIDMKGCRRLVVTQQIKVSELSRGKAKIQITDYRVCQNNLSSPG